MAQQRNIGNSDKSITAVEWFIDAITESGHLWMTDKPNDMLELAKFIEQAKQMEKEQIMDAVERGSKWAFIGLKIDP